MGGSAALTGLPPLPPGATMNPAGGALPPLPPGATLGSGPPATAPKTGMRGFEDMLEQPSPGLGELPFAGPLAAGALKSAGSLAGNILDMVSRPLYKLKVNGEEMDSRSPEQLRASQHVEDAANWLKSGGQAQGFWENVGAVGEQVLEFMGTDGLLKLVGPAAGAVETGEHLKQAQQVAQTVKANPKLAGLLTIGLKAAKDATMMGAQTYGHSEDPGQAAAAAATGGAFSGAAGLAAMGARALRELGPKALEIAGEKVPVLANQVDEAGGLTGTTATAQGAGKIAAQQQQAAPAVTRNIAREGLETSLNRINATRELIPAGRQLPAPPDAAPFRFTLETGPAAEERTGEMAQSAAMAPRHAFEDPAYLTASAPTRTAEFAPNGRVIAGQEGTTGADLGSGETPQPGQETVGGGGPLTTSSPQQAEQWLRGIEDAQAAPEYRKLPQAQQDALERSRQALQNQLGMYHAGGSRFAPRDVPAALGWTNSFGDAAAQARATAEPVYQQMDAASQGEFAKYRDAARQALGVIQRGSTLDAIETAQQRYAEANEKINDIFTRHGDRVNGADYRGAKMAWRDGATFDMLHAITERMANGVTMEETERGLPRVVKGKPEVFENWLAKANQFGPGSNRDRVEDLIGSQGVDNLKKMMMLTRDAKLARATNNVLMSTAQAAREIVGPAGWGALAGAAAAQAMGLPGYQGALAGAGAASAARIVFRYAVTSPEIGNMIDFAARNAVGREHYAPILARMVAQAAGLEDQGRKEQEPGTREQGAGESEETQP